MPYPATDSQRCYRITNQGLRRGRDWVFFRVLTLLGSIVVTIACAGFIGFLWYGTVNSETWSLIVLNGWTTRAITLTSVLLRTAITAQAALCLSMMAAIALERSAVPLADVCSISAIRAGGDKGLLSALTEFAWPMIRRGHRFDQLVLPTVLLTLIWMALSQFISTALMSDVTLQLVPGRNETVNLPYDFVYDPERERYTFQALSANSLWEAGLPSLFPTFAEYSQPPFRHDNVSDTGLSLRAFLALAAHERPLVRNYSGKALVLDSRVTCQRPVVDAELVLEDNNYLLRGRARPSVSTPRLDNVTTADFSYWKADFSCLYESHIWSICQLPNDAVQTPLAKYSGGLVSEFREFPLVSGQNKSGAALLLMSPYRNSPFPNTSVVDLALNRSEFVAFPTESSRLAITLCYTSFDVANRWVRASSSKNRTEPSASWKGGVFDLAAVAAQLDTGYTSDQPIPSAEERGILRLEPPKDWSAPQSEQRSNDGPAIVESTYQSLHCLTWRLHLRDFSAMGDSSVFGNYVAALSTNETNALISDPDLGTCSDIWLTQLFEHLFVTASSSVALQAVITSLAGIEYYNRIGQFDKSDNISVVYLVNEISPGGPLGQKRVGVSWSFGALLVFLVTQTALVAIVTIRFLAQTTTSRIGDYWQAFGQIALSDVAGLKEGLKDAVNPNQKGIVPQDYAGDYVRSAGETGVVVKT
ncbi:hypothetical protein DL770_003598 [Monosporascus sp. CRB-9-2]|nr:hypothetical protein DL770_003598 [Monosporascus sp. CRB-9-2]